MKRNLLGAIICGYLLISCAPSTQMANKPVAPNPATGPGADISRLETEPNPNFPNDPYRTLNSVPRPVPAPITAPDIYNNNNNNNNDAAFWSSIVDIFATTGNILANNANSGNGNYNDNKEFGLGCTPSSGTQNFSLGSSSNGRLIVTPVCTSYVNSTSQTEIKKPIDIVFVVDVTKSMQPNIEAIRSSIIEISRDLEVKGWNPRFASVNFRDSIGSTSHAGNPYFELMKVSLSYMTATQLAEEISTYSQEKGQKWYAYDESSYQEAGQMAIMVAIDFLEKVTKREDADHIIVYVSDAPAFMGTSQNLFSTDALASRMRNTALNLKFYHSTLNQSDSRYDSIKYSDVKVINAHQQMVDMLVKANFSAARAVSLDYPLSKGALLNQFLPTFQTVTNKTELDCYISNAKLKNSAEMNWENQIGYESKNSPLRFNKILTSGNYNYVEERNCKKRGDNTYEKSYERNLNILVQ